MADNVQINIDGKVLECPVIVGTEGPPGKLGTRKLGVEKQTLGCRTKDIFWRIVLPATLPSIVVGMTVGIGICWNTVVAAEMIASRSGLGFLTWRSYVTFTYPMIVVGMISIGIAGYISSGIIRILGDRLMPWLKTN